VATLLIDATIDGHGELIARRLGADYWREMRDHVGIQLLHFEQIGLDRAAKDDVVWRLCQEREFYLLTDNRNHESEDSLEATIRREGTPQTVPVFTLGNADRLYQSATYLDKGVEKLLDCLLDEVSYRGAGRVFLP
jgi:hypothetical protein